MFRLIGVISLIILTSAVFMMSLPAVDGCAAVNRPDGPSISIAEESAIIVWDPVKKVQHFIRRAAFDTKSPDFGFLVPTPTMPETPFQVVEDGIFSAASTWLVPRTVEQTRLQMDPMFCMFGCSAKKATMMDGVAKAPAVKVLHDQKVGGYDVNVLAADNAEELANWIKKHGYSADPELYEWLTPYVASKWKISAFKISQDPKTGTLARTKAVRMTFQTDRPFFPYREPEKQKAKPTDKDKADGDFPPPRLLRVLFVSDGRFDGMLGTGVWHATVPWSDALTDEQRKQIIQETGVPEESVPKTAWLTTFEDRSSPRPGKEEVYFEPSSERTPIRPPDHIRYNDVWIPFDCVFVGVIFVGMGVLALVRRLRKRPLAA
ncbi:MAG TPA: DUF2330 domain-containing protein [Gemmataceae bacterium]|nr:DUF2330 domain-containing protein [Gemmataceae bacterium]